jgi:hypothetical protein
VLFLSRLRLVERIATLKRSPPRRPLLDLPATVQRPRLPVQPLAPRPTFLEKRPLPLKPTALDKPVMQASLKISFTCGKCHQTTRPRVPQMLPQEQVPLLAMRPRLLPLLPVAPQAPLFPVAGPRPLVPVAVPQPLPLLPALAQAPPLPWADGLKPLAFPAERPQDTSPSPGEFPELGQLLRPPALPDQREPLLALRDEPVSLPAEESDHAVRPLRPETLLGPPLLPSGDPVPLPADNPAEIDPVPTLTEVLLQAPALVLADKE